MDKNDINATYYDQGRHSHHHQPQLRKILGKSAYHYGETHINKVEELLKGSGIEVRIRNYQ